MDQQPVGSPRVARLIEQGVKVMNPATVDVGEEVELGRISGDSVVLFPGCRIYGAKTVISAGVKLGAEGPVTVDDCRLGPKVELKGGYFKRSVFLEKANMGLGAQVREACLLEEEANGAHCVGLKQTILFPFVTLGSLINFCDCLMAGGTSRKDHSEVGSSYIHFNYTPDGDKTTASLFGDVPRGVMLNQPAIFLGGQGGSVGPVRMGFGTVVSAGSVLRDDVADGKLVFADPGSGFERDRVPRSYKRLGRIVRNNLVYLANLVALEEWYVNVRQLFFAKQRLGGLVYEGALEMLAMAKEERTKRLAAMAEKVPTHDPGARELRENIDRVCAVFDRSPSVPRKDDFLEAFRSRVGDKDDYIQAIQGLTPDLSGLGVHWLQQIVDVLCGEAAGMLLTLAPFTDKA